MHELPTLQSHTKQSVLVTRLIITQKTECANDQRNDRTEKRICELPT